MPRSARPAAACSMKECVMPAPAPWANTKQARACGGFTSSAETEVALPTSMTIFCGVLSFIAAASPARDNSATHATSRLIPPPWAPALRRPSIGKSRVYAAIRERARCRGRALAVTRKLTVPGITVVSSLETVRVILGRRCPRAERGDCQHRDEDQFAHGHFL